MGVANISLGLLLKEFDQTFAFWSLLASGSTFLILANLDRSYFARLSGFEKSTIITGLLDVLNIRRMIELSFFVGILLATIISALSYRSILSALIPLTLIIAIALVLTLRTEWELGLIKERQREH